MLCDVYSLTKIDTDSLYNEGNLSVTLELIKVVLLRQKKYFQVLVQKSDWHFSIVTDHFLKLNK